MCIYKYVNMRVNVEDNSHKLIKVHFISFFLMNFMAIIELGALKYTFSDPKIV